jgi:RecB family endonuclease NucS
MQIAVRKQLHHLEDGLEVDDGGNETVVTTGKIDIVARDKKKNLVVIELKAGLCPSGAIEQVLGYAEALSEERKESVRAYLIAGEFSDRTRAAARRVRDLQLRTYEFSIKFNTVAELKG